MPDASLVIYNTYNIHMLWCGGRLKYMPNRRQQPEVVRGFLRASSRGFQSAAQHPAEAADILCKAAPALDRRLAHASQEYVSKVQAYETIPASTTHAWPPQAWA